MEITLKTTEDEIIRGAEEVEALCERVGFAPERRDEVRTAVVEALSNAMIHGNRRRDESPIRLRTEIDGSAVLVEVTDIGEGPTELPPAPNLQRKLNGLESPGGWGVHLMRLLATKVEFLIRPGGDTRSGSGSTRAPRKRLRPRRSGGTTMREYPTKVDVRQMQKARVVRLPTQLTARTEEALAPAIEESLDAPTRFVVVDFSSVRNTDSAGIGLLFGLLQKARNRGVSVALAAVQGQPLMILERVRLPRYVPMFDTVEDALASALREADED